MAVIAVMGVALFAATPVALASAPAVTRATFPEMTPHSALLEAEVRTGMKFTEHQLEYDTRPSEKTKARTTRNNDANTDLHRSRRSSSPAIPALKPIPKPEPGTSNCAPST